MLAYGIPDDLVDEYVRMIEPTCLPSLYSFCKAVVAVFDPEYLRQPNVADTERMLAINADRGFPGMLGSIDCSHNDINVMQRSPVFARLAEGHSPPVNFEINGHHYNKGYYLADGIYPQWSTFVKTTSKPQGKLWEVMTACVIMHNMIVEDERDNSIFDQGFDFRGENVEPLHQEPATFEQFAQFHLEMRDWHTHLDIQNELVEHM
ncbi:uncharacterized protein [Aegilops tauschii subsp. strangulata]|uniref:uncharacterized protein n=1 Tax=Aegilops tauschii subsp. strangulata TaxID=200361 RepID=UPI00098AC567|nr:uncharacterized protein LOC109742426 [Aegilops tauschii subsp. strangulata]